MKIALFVPDTKRQRRPVDVGVRQEPKTRIRKLEFENRVQAECARDETRPFPTDKSANQEAIDLMPNK